MTDIHVKIAEVHTGTEGQVLKAILGSCIGIAFIWKKKKLCGLAHCLLPETEQNQHILGAKHVNQAIISLMKIMEIKKSDVGEIEVYLAGAGNMMNQILKSKSSQVGKSNEEAARKYLAYYGFKVTEEKLGFNTGSKITVNCTDYTVTFDQLEELNVAGLKKA